VGGGGGAGRPKRLLDLFFDGFLPGGEGKTGGKGGAGQGGGGENKKNKNAPGAGGGHCPFRKGPKGGGGAGGDVRARPFGGPPQKGEGGCFRRRKFPAFFFSGPGKQTKNKKGARPRREKGRRISEFFSRGTKTPNPGPVERRAVGGGGRSVGAPRRKWSGPCHFGGPAHSRAPRAKKGGKKGPSGNRKKAFPARGEGWGARFFFCPEGGGGGGTFPYSRGAKRLFRGPGHGEPTAIDFGEKIFFVEGRKGDGVEWGPAERGTHRGGA